LVAGGRLRLLLGYGQGGDLLSEALRPDHQLLDLCLEMLESVGFLGERGERIIAWRPTSRSSWRSSAARSRALKSTWMVSPSSPLTWHRRRQRST
jgi:hypothetical protein